VGVVATIWLAATGRLTLYVHPRYTLLTVMMAVLTLLLLVLTAAVRVSPAVHEHSDHDRVTHVSAFGGLLIWSKAAVLICAALALVVIPPATLSSTARQNRELVTSGQALDSTKAAALVGADPATLSVKDWAALLSQGGPEAVLGKHVDLTGYVLDRGQGDVFFVARLVVSCCAVDAQSVGVPVYRPGWREEIESGVWIRIEGAFVKNPSLRQEPEPREPRIGGDWVGSLAKIDEPDQPYVSDPPNREHRFRLTAAVTIGALLLAVAGLTAANAVRGPRLLDVQINPAAAVEGAGQRLVLRVDQTVAHLTADQVTVTPSVPVETTSDRAALILRFTDSLRYATSYQIAAKVRSATTGASSTLRYSFRTPEGAFYVLQRATSNADADAPNQIVRHVIGSTEQGLGAQPSAHRAVRRRRSSDRGRYIRCRRCRYAHRWPHRRVQAKPNARRQFRDQPTEIVGAERALRLCADPVE
jgi:uncharacterized repeat protein (TIGR03943 family)